MKERRLKFNGEGEEGELVSGQEVSVCVLPVVRR